MDQLTGLLPFLGSYPSWVRLVVLLYFLGGVGGYAGLVLYAPAASFGLDAVRLVGPVEAGRPLVLDLLGRNPTKERVLVRELRLAFHGGELPTGGLQGFESASASYEVGPADASRPDGGALKVRSGQETLANTAIVYPFAGQDYAEIVIPVAQSIDKDATDRFRVRLSAPDFPRPTQRALDLVAVYNGDKETPAYRLDLR